MITTVSMVEPKPSTRARPSATNNSLGVNYQSKKTSTSREEEEKIKISTPVCLPLVFAPPRKKTECVSIHLDNLAARLALAHHRLHRLLQLGCRHRVKERIEARTRL
jgi:hypothetical protein